MLDMAEHCHYHIYHVPCICVEAVQCRPFRAMYFGFASAAAHKWHMERSGFSHLQMLCFRARTKSAIRHLNGSPVCAMPAEISCNSVEKILRKCARRCRNFRQTIRRAFCCGNAR